MKEIRLFALGSFFHRRVLHGIREVNAGEQALDRRALRAQLPLAWAGTLVTGAGLVWAVTRVRAGELTLGDVSLFLASTAGLQSAVGGLVTGISDVHQASLSFGYFAEIVDAPADLPRDLYDQSKAKPADMAVRAAYCEQL